MKELEILIVRKYVYVSCTHIDARARGVYNSGIISSGYMDDDRGVPS